MSHLHVAPLRLAGVYVDRFLSRISKTGTCWAWTGTKKNDGYGTFFAPKNGEKPGNWIASRYAYEIFLGDTTGKCVLHRCDNPICVNPDHLFLGTLADNVRDCVAKGRNKFGHVPGALNGRAKLSAESVKLARHLYFAERRNYSEIARFFGVRHTAIIRCVNKISWKCV